MKVDYFFFVVDLIDFGVLGFFEAFATEGFDGLEEGVVFFAVAGFEARFRFEADGLALAAVFLVAALFTAAFLTDLGRGSVFKVAEADTGSAGGACLAASRQFGKNNSIR